MASVLVIPIILVAVIGLSAYLVYRFVLYDISCKRSVERMLKRYSIKKTPSQIVREYYEMRGDSLTDRDVQVMEKDYRQNEPDQFLEMYDAIREGDKRNGQ